MKKLIIFLYIVLLSITLVAQEDTEKKRLRLTLELENKGIIIDNEMRDYLADESGERVKYFIGKLINVNISESYVVSNRISKAKGLYYDEPRWKHRIEFLLKLEFVIDKRHFILFYLTGTGIWEIGREFLISIYPDGIVTIELKVEEKK